MKKKLLSALLCLALALTLLPTAALAAPTRLKSVDLVIDLPKAGDPNEMETEVTIKSMKSGNIDLLANGAGILYTEWQGDDVETDDGYAFRAGTTYLVNIKLAFDTTKGYRANYQTVGGENIVGPDTFSATVNGVPATIRTSAQYFPLGDDMYPVLLEELRKAERYIFMEYFIVDEGYMWSSILVVLKENAAEGVEVALADLAGVGDQIARVGLAKGELLDAALFHIGCRHVAVQNAVGTDKRRVDAQRTQGILGRWSHKSGGAATVHAAHQAQVAVFARLEQVKHRERNGHIDGSHLVCDSERAPMRSHVGCAHCLNLILNEIRPRSSISCGALLYTDESTTECIHYLASS